MFLHLGEHTASPAGTSLASHCPSNCSRLGTESWPVWGPPCPQCAWLSPEKTCGVLRVLWSHWDCAGPQRNPIEHDFFLSHHLSSVWDLIIDPVQGTAAEQAAQDVPSHLQGTGGLAYHGKSQRCLFGNRVGSSSISWALWSGKSPWSAGEWKGRGLPVVTSSVGQAEVGGWV